MQNTNNQAMNGQIATAGTSTLDIGDVLRGIWQRKLMILIVTALAFILSIVFVTVAKPVYKAESRILVENLETPFIRSTTDTARRNEVSQQDVKSQVNVVESRDLAKRVIKDLNLTSLPEFDPLKKKGSIISSLLVAVGFSPDMSNWSKEQRALRAYYKKLSVYQIPRSNVIVISVRAKSARVAAQIANKLAEEYVASTRESQLHSTGQARNWLATQIESLRDKVVKSEMAAEEYRARAGLLRGGRDGSVTLSAQQLSELNSQIILAEAARSEAQAKARAIREMLRNTGSVSGSSDVLNSPLIQRLRERQISLRGQLADLSTTYMSNHPRIKAIKRQIAGLDRQVRNEALKIVSGLDQQAKIAATREASLRASLNGLKAKVSGTNLDEVKLRALEREATANRTLLETFLNKYSDASAREDVGAQPGMARVISRADIPASPYFPKKGPTVLLATLGGFFLATGIAFMASMMSALAAPASIPAPAPVNYAANQPEIRPQPAPVHNMTTAQPAQPQPGMRQPVVAPVPQPATSAQPVARPIVQPARPVVQQPATPAPAPQPAAPVRPQVPKYFQPQAATSDFSPAAPTVSSLSQIHASGSLQIAAANAQTIIQQPQSPFSQAIIPVASWINSCRQTLGVKKVAIVALAGSETDSAASSLAIARSLAIQGVRTLVMDADMTGNGFGSLLNLSNRPGLSDLVCGKSGFMDVIVKDQISDLRIITAGLYGNEAWPLLSSDRMSSVYQALLSDDTHDLIIVNGGELAPAERITNGAVSYCDGAVLMVPAAKMNIAGSALQLLEMSGMRAVHHVSVIQGNGVKQHTGNVTPISPGFGGQADSAFPGRQAI